MLSMAEKDIKSICHANHQQAKANSKYIKYYDKNKEVPYLKY